MSQTHTIGKHATKVTKDGQTSTVRYWSTDVVKVNWDTGIITLNTGGWDTATTKLRMNQASREWGLGYHVYQHKGDWFVNADGLEYNYTVESTDPRGEVFSFATRESQNLN